MWVWVRITWCSWFLSPVCPAVEPVLSEPGPVATILRELRLRELLREHTGRHKHTVASVLWRPLPASSTSAHLGPLVYPHWVLWCWGTGHPRAASFQPTASPLRGFFPNTGPGIFFWIQTGNNDLLFSVCPLTLFLFFLLPASFLTKDLSPAPWSYSEATVAEGGPLLPTSPSPAPAPQLPRPSCSWLYILPGAVLLSTFQDLKKKKNQKLKKKKKNNTKPHKFKK